MRLDVDEDGKILKKVKVPGETGRGMP